MAGPLTWEEARPRILPLLESPAFFAAMDEAAPGAPPLLRFPVVEDELALALVLPGEGRTMRFLSRADAGAWGRPAEAIRLEALANLAARIRGRLTIAVTHGVIARFEEAPWFKATLAVLPDVRGRLADALGGEEPILALPDRDSLIALAPRARPAWTRALPKLAEEHARAKNPLSDALFQVGRPGLAFAGRLG